jgi:hypothetical protein
LRFYTDRPFGLQSGEYSLYNAVFCLPLKMLVSGLPAPAREVQNIAAGERQGLVVRFNKNLSPKIRLKDVRI